MKEVQSNSASVAASAVQTQTKKFSNIPPLNAASDIYWCMERVVKRQNCKNLKFIFDGGGRLIILRMKVCNDVLQKMKGKSTLKFQSLEEYELLKSCCLMYIQLAKTHQAHEKMRNDIWEQVQALVAQECETFYTGSPAENIDLDKFKFIYSL